VNRRPAYALVVVVAAAFGCSANPPTPPAPARESSPSPAGVLPPSTSRDEAPPSTARGALSSAPLPAGHPPVAEVAATKPVGGTVSLAPELASRVQPTDVLYLIARNRAAQTVAVRRETGIRFPHTFELSSADAMVADQPFVGPFDITARLSKSGDAFPAPGDLEGTTLGVAEGARSVAVVIAKVRQ
jgi:cytochrome c-type biogenesis protein CcmH